MTEQTGTEDKDLWIQDFSTCVLEAALFPSLSPPLGSLPIALDGETGGAGDEVRKVCDPLLTRIGLGTGPMSFGRTSP